MNVRLDRVGHLEVDHERDVRDIDSTSGEVGRDEDVALARADRVERRFSLLLVLTRVQGGDAPLVGSKARSQSCEAGERSMENGNAHGLVGGPS